MYANRTFAVRLLTKLSFVFDFGSNIVISINFDRKDYDQAFFNSNGRISVI